MRAALTLIVLVLNVIAIVSILGSRTGRGRRLGWTVAVVLLPLVGALGWLIVGRDERKLAGTE
jgi:hypothetical protein